VVSLTRQTSVATTPHRYLSHLALQLRNAHYRNLGCGQSSLKHSASCLADVAHTQLAWAWLFFDRHRLFASGVALVFATLFAIPLLVISFNASPVLGFAFVPYQLWLVLATSIAFGFSAQ
jgi:tryptophan-rich sensory protein